MIIFFGFAKMFDKERDYAVSETAHKLDEFFWPLCLSKSLNVHNATVSLNKSLFESGLYQ
jgi:hypothetical protein